jgi:hypothetical protein
VSLHPDTLEIMDMFPRGSVPYAVWALEDDWAFHSSMVVRRFTKDYDLYTGRELDNRVFMALHRLSLPSGHNRHAYMASFGMTMSEWWALRKENDNATT